MFFFLISVFTKHLKNLTIVPNRLVMSLAFALLFMPLDGTRAQATRGSDQDEDVVRIESTLVQLNVGVADRAGRSVTNLSPNDFTVYEDDVRQDIINFEPTMTPFSLVLLLDVSGSTIGFRTTLKQAALRFIDALAPEDRVAVIAFNERTNVLSTFTTSRDKTAFAISRAEGRGGTELYKALSFALKQLEGEGKRRKAIVVLTDGIDSGMRDLDRATVAGMKTDEEALSAIRPEKSPALSSVLDAADRQGVTIYPLALPSGDPKRIPIPSPSQVAIYSGARERLQILADRTGGRLNQIQRLEDMGRLYAVVAADLRTLYSISYQSSAKRARDGRWRSIRIEVANPSLIARTRPGYFAR
ncbi:MAG: VWA domain-containing protein [Pyrinomonadaceae bacterium]|nr:VWA domain-containing protein [Pyrinomonadaceae bacterium]